MRTTRILPLLAALLAPVLSANAQDTAAVTRLLTSLSSDDPEIRKDAIDRLQTSLDPRIPEACLPVLLHDAGESTRRQAARAIGSRWWQIPKERVPAFTAVLKAQAGAHRDNEGLVNMSLRGLALLNRSYDNPMVSRSPDKRWVIYERRGLPCLIDTRTHSEELLGYPAEARMSCSFVNQSLAPTVRWHPRKPMVAISMLVFRRPGLVWIWTEGRGITPIDRAFVARALNRKLEEVSEPLTNVELGKWTKRGFEFPVEYVINDETDAGFPEGWKAEMRWDPESGKVEVFRSRIARDL